jgi:hypothetical protein
MSVSEGLGEGGIAARKPGGVLIFVPMLIAVLGAAAIFLGQAADRATAAGSGYGIDERVTGAISAPDTDGGVINFGP